MKKIGLFIALAALFSAVSCNHNNPIPIDDYSQDPVIEKDATKFTCKNISWVGAKNEYYDEFASRSNTVSGTISESTSVIFLDMGATSANLGNLGKSYDNGSVIVVLNPQMDAVAKLMERSGWYHMYPSTDDIVLYAFSSKGAYALHKPQDATEVESEDELEQGTEAGYEYDAKDIADGADPYADMDFSEIGYYLKPFVEWVNGVTSGTANEDLDGYAIFTAQKNYDLKLKVHKCLWSDTDYIKGPYTVSVNYKYKPLYIFADQSYAPGDYYIFNASYISETTDIFKGDDFTHKHGGITVHITGAFLRELNVVTYIDGDGTSPQFIQGFEPIPGSDINTKDYSKTHSWNIGGGVTGGYSKQEKGKVEAEFNWGVSNSNTVSYSVSDLGIKNTYHTDYQSHGAAAAWSFFCQNLPGPKGDKGFNGDTPTIAKSTATFPTSWIWRSMSHPEWDDKPLGEIVTVINPVLGGAHNGLCVDGEKNTWKLEPAEFRAQMVVPFRIPFGTARINNSFKDGEVLSDIVVTDVETGDVAYKSSGDFNQSKPCEFSVAEGQYDITMKVTGTDRVTTDYKLINPIDIKRRTSENNIYDIDAYIRFAPVSE